MDGGDEVAVFVVVVFSVVAALVFVESGIDLGCAADIGELSRLDNFVRYSGDSETGNDLLVGVPVLLLQVKFLNFWIAFIYGLVLAGVVRSQTTRWCDLRHIGGASSS